MIRSLCLRFRYFRRFADPAPLAPNLDKLQLQFAATTLPETVIDSVLPVVSDGLQKMQQNNAKALGVLQGDSPACQGAAGAFKAVYADSVAANKQLASMRAALETQKVALLHWNQGIQTTLGSND